MMSRLSYRTGRITVAVAAQAQAATTPITTSSKRRFDITIAATVSDDHLRITPVQNE
jgi:hypothetical protein